MKSPLSRYLTLANPFSRAQADVFPKMYDDAPFKPGWRLSSDKKTNFVLWNALGVASWTVPLALAVTALVNAKAKREVDKERDRSEDQLLAAGRPVLTPTPLTEKAPKDNAKRLDNIAEDAKNISKKAADLSPFKGVIESTIPILALPASYWLANKLATKFISDKISSDLEEERVSLRKLQDAEDLERLKLLGMVKSASNSGIEKKADSFFENIAKPFSNVSLTGVGKAALWDALLIPAVAASALLAVGGGAYLSKRDRDAKKVKLLTKKLLGENRMHDPSMLSINLPSSVISSGNEKQMHRIEGLPVSEDPRAQSALENSKEKDALFS